MIAHIDLDAFFASVEQRDHPELQGKPVVVGFVTPQGNFCNRGVVSAASYEVRKHGVYSGMSLWEAKKLCPEAIIISGNFGKYEEASQQMYQILSQHSPYVEPLSLDEAFISFEGCEEIYPDLVCVCQRIKDQIKSEIGITASIGLASNKLVAKVASDFQKPDGLTVVRPDTEKDFLAPLPIVKLYGVGPAISARLTQLGIKTVGQLANFPKIFLKVFFGKHGETLWMSANGLGESTLTPSFPPKSVGRSTTFLHDSSGMTYLHQNLTYLAEKVVVALAEEKMEGRCLTLTLRDGNFRTWSHQKVLTAPVSTSERILIIAKKLLDEAWNKQTPLRLLGIAISHLTPISCQLPLWPDLAKEKILTTAVDKIRKKFGFWAISPASIVDLNSTN